MPPARAHRPAGARAGAEQSRAGAAQARIEALRAQAEAEAARARVEAEEAEAVSFKRHHWQHYPEKLLAMRMQQRKRELAAAAAPTPGAPGCLRAPELDSAQLELHALDMAFGKGGWLIERRHAAIDFESHDPDTGIWVVGVSIIVRLCAADKRFPHHDDVACAFGRRRDRQHAREEALLFAGRKAHKRLCSYLYGVLPRELVDRARSSRLH